MQTYGIENLKVVIADIAEIVENVQNTLTDGKLSWFESVKLGLAASPKIAEIVENAENIKNEFTDLDRNEKNELMQILAQQLEIEKNDALEKLLEAILDTALSMSVTVNLISNLKKTV